MSSQTGREGPSPAQPPVPAERFEWHPSYRGRDVTTVRDELRHEVARDQRTYALVLEGAERDENAALATVIELEKKWGQFDMDWAEADPAALADRIVAFERERERRRELVAYADYRASLDASPAAAGHPRLPDDARERSPVPQSRLLWLALVVAVVAAIVVILALI